MLLSHRADMITPVHGVPRPLAGTHSHARARRGSQFKDTIILLMGRGTRSVAEGVTRSERVFAGTAGRSLELETHER